MGLRSWLTRVGSVEEYLALIPQIRHNPFAYGIAYTIKIPRDCPLGEGVWVAWSGDGRSSLEDYMASCFFDQTFLLDDVLDTWPEFDEPSTCGEILGSDTSVIRCLAEEHDYGDTAILAKVTAEMAFAKECSSALSGDGKSNKQATV